VSSVALKYRWRRSNGTDALQGVDHGQTIGRVERALSGDYWLWFMTCDRNNTADVMKLCRLNGAARTAAHAAAACEASYEAISTKNTGGAP